jgi:hypothetical protein
VCSVPSQVWLPQSLKRSGGLLPWRIMRRCMTHRSARKLARDALAVDVSPVSLLWKINDSVFSSMTKSLLFRKGSLSSWRRAQGGAMHGFIHAGRSGTWHVERHQLSRPETRNILHQLWRGVGRWISSLPGRNAASSVHKRPRSTKRSRVVKNRPHGDKSSHA